MLSKIEERRVAEQFRLFGCTQREAEIYLQCLQLGPAPVQDIARKLRQNRVTVHSAVENLLRKGILFETRKGRRRLIAAEAPENLRQLAQERENELHVMRANLEYTIQLLAPLRTSDRGTPTVKFYEGVEGFKKMLEESLEAKGEVLVFTYVDLFSRLLGTEYLENYFRRRAKRGISTRLIFPPCEFAERVNRDRLKHKIQVRLLPPELEWRSGIFSWNDSLALMSYTEEKLTCTIIENADIAQFYRGIIFDLAWRQAAPMAD